MSFPIFRNVWPDCLIVKYSFRVKADEAPIDAEHVNKDEDEDVVHISDCLWPILMGKELSWNLGQS